LPESLSSPTRRLILLGVIVAAGALLWTVAQRRDAPQPVSAGGNFGVCSKTKGEAARACYSREVGRELAVVGATAPEITIAAPAGTGEVTFSPVETQAQAQAPLLCELHERVGVTDAQVPSWLGWTEPLARAAPVS
jgi:2-keto-3-deoxy-6-phosphogluconate aldolase